MPPVTQPDPLECSLTCPNRRREGITLQFGKKPIHVDLFELMLFGLILALPVGMSLRDAWNDKLTFQDSVARIGAILGLGTAVRASPTEKISDALANFNIGKK